MRRYWIDKDIISGELIDLKGDLFHHVCDVCRVQVGQKFEVLVDGGTAYFVEMIEVLKKSAVAKILEKRQLPPLPTPNIHLCLSLPKFQKIDFIVEKSVELGVKSIIPFVSDNSFVRKVSNVPYKKIERWRKIIISATQQSARGDLMRVSAVKQLKDVLTEIEFNTQSVGVFTYEGGCDKNLKQFVESSNESEINDVFVFVGSEGGFSYEEVEMFKDHQLQPVTVGDQVLRVETACISIVSMLKYAFQL